MAILFSKNKNRKENWLTELKKEVDVIKLTISRLKEHLKVFDHIFYTAIKSEISS